MKAAKNPPMPMPMAFGQPSPALQAVPTKAKALPPPPTEPKVPKAPSVVHGTADGVYTVPCYPGSYRPFPITGWTGTGSCVIRSDALQTMPAAFNDLPVDRVDGVDDIVKGYLSEIAAQPLAFQKRHVFPYTYAVEAHKRQVRIDLNAVLFVADDNKTFFFVDALFGPPPQTMYAKKTGPIIAVADAPKDAKLLGAVLNQEDDNVLGVAGKLWVSGETAAAQAIVQLHVLIEPEMANPDVDRRLSDGLDKIGSSFLDPIVKEARALMAFPKFRGTTTAKKLLSRALLVAQKPK
jgi:hypothetical protein